MHTVCARLHGFLLQLLEEYAAVNEADKHRQHGRDATPDVLPDVLKGENMNVPVWRRP